MKKKLLIILIPLFIIIVGITGIVYASWIVATTSKSEEIVDATYKIDLVDGSDTTAYQLLEIESNFYLPEKQNILEEKKFFVGWSLTSDGTGDIAPGDYNLKTYLANIDSNNKLTLYAIWTNTIPSGKVLVNVTYPTDQKLSLLINKTETFYLFNVNVPAKSGDNFLNGFSSSTNYTHTTYTGNEVTNNSFGLNDYFTSSNLTSINEINLTAVYI